MTIGRDSLGDKGEKRGSGGKFNVRQSDAVFCQTAANLM